MPSISFASPRALDKRATALREAKRPLRVYFSPAVTRRNDIIGRALEKRYKVEQVSESPEVAFHSDTSKAGSEPFGRINILVAIENTYPDFRKYQGSLTYLQTSDRRNMRLPNYALICRPEDLIKGGGIEPELAAEKREFCAFVASNMNAFRTKKRIDFFHALNRLQPVASGGKLLNNIGERVGNLHDFYRRFRFCIAFENQPFSGYTTEKMVYAMRAGCIPIYWGNPDIAADFNQRSFIDVRSFRSDQEAIQHILEVWQSPELTRSYLGQSYLHGNSAGVWFDDARIATFLAGIIDQPARSNRNALVPKLHKLLLKCYPYTGERFSSIVSQLYLHKIHLPAWD